MANERLRAFASAAATLSSLRSLDEIACTLAAGALAATGASSATVVVSTERGCAVATRPASPGGGAALPVVVMPLRDVSGGALGTLRLGCRPGARIGLADLEIVDHLVRIAATACETSRLHDAALQRQRRADELTRVARVLTEHLDATTVARHVVDGVFALFDVKAALLRLIANDGTLVAIAASGVVVPHFDPGQAVPPGVSTSGRALVEGRPIYIPDLHADPTLTPQIRQRVVAAGLRAGLAAPLAIDGRVVGVLSVADTRVRAFTGDEVATLQAFADQAALAIENARLYEEATRTRDFLRSITVNSADAIVTTDLAGRATYISPGAEAMFGIRDGDAGSLRAAEFYEAGEPEARRVMSEVLARGQLTNYETRMRTPDGRAVDVIASISLLRDRDGALAGTLAVMKDVTARRRAEEALRESEMRYRRIVETADEGIWTIDAEARVEYVNQRMADLLGYTAEELRGRSLYEFIDADMHAKVTAYLGLVGAAGHHRSDYRLRRRDGSELWASVSACPIIDSSGEFRGFLGMIVDITERTHAERALADRTQGLEAVRAVTAEITRELDLTSLLDIIVHRATELVGGDAAGIHLWDPDAQVLVPATIVGFTDEWARHHQRRLGEGTAGVAAQRREGIIVNDYPNWPKADRHFLERVPIEASLAQPLLYRGGLLGAIVVSRRDPRPFVAEDLELLGLFADQAAVAIENSRLFTREQQARAEAERSSVRYQTLVQDLDVIVWEADADSGEVTFVSRRAEALLGYPVADWLGSSARWLSRVHPDDREPLITRRREADRRGEPETVSYRMRAADGRMVWLRDRFHVVVGEGGRGQLRGTTADITDARVRSRQHAVVRELGERALAGGPIGEVMEAAARALAETLDVPQTAVFERRPERADLVLRAGMGWADDAVGTATAALVADARLDPQSPLLVAHGIRSMLTVWMLDGADAFWLVAACAPAVRQFTADEHAFAAAVANVLGLALGRTRAEEALKRYNQQLAVLREVDYAILAARTPEAAAHEALGRLRRLVPCMRAGVTEFDADTEDMIVLAVDGAGSDDPCAGRRGPTEPCWKLDALRRDRIQTIEPALAGAGSPLMSALVDEAAGALLTVPLIAEGDLIGAVHVAVERLDGVTADHLEVTREVARSLAPAVQHARLHERVRAGHERLTLLSRRLVEVQEAERRHIARELHDQVGQVLTGLKLRLDACSVAARGRSVAAALDEAHQLVNDLMGRVRELSLDLRPAMLDDFGLVATLLWHFDRYTAHTGVRVLFRHAGLEDRRFSADLETAAYRIVQEALTNVARHAGVRDVTVRLWTQERALAVQIEDAGVGFDARAVPPSGRTGLSGMRERAVLLGGDLTLETSPGDGARLTAELPIPEAAT